MNDKGGGSSTIGPAFDSERISAGIRQARLSRAQRERIVTRNVATLLARF